MLTTDALTEKLEYLDPGQVEQIRNAYSFAEKAHEGQYRRTGDPYIAHPLAVGLILAGMHMDAPSIMAGLLHDVIEDTHVSKEAIAKQFGETVADLVDGVSKIGAIKFESKAEAQAENFRKMMLAMTKDIRVILVKLADRLHNMRTLGVLHPQKRRRIATETLEIYAPIANRLGMNDVRIELEDLGFQQLYPMRATRIKKAIIKARGNRKDMMGNIQSAIVGALGNSQITARVIGREKHLYSIYQKMKTQRKPFNEIMDVYGFRIIVDCIDSCYRTLGVVHNLHKPIPGRFKDYIAIPKSNGYQSLHTTLKGQNGVPIEIQIRTEEMEDMANSGIASHWLYKSDNDDPAGGAQNRAKEWLKGLVEMQQRAGTSLEFIENVKIDLFPDEVYVFTPKGRILELPAGATPVDFAYAVHTDVGNACVAARIDHRLVPLSTAIQSGQTIQIITAPGARPNPAWLSFVTTAKARANIRHFLKTQRRSESVELGKRLLDKALGAYELSLDILPQERVRKALEEAGFQQLDDMLEDIGLGNQMAQLAARRLLPPEGGGPDSSDQSRPLVIRGTEGLIINFAKCCRPIPGDAIVGHLSAGKGMMVHRDNCRNITQEQKQNPEKCLSVQWASDAKGEFSVDLKVELANERGILAILANSLSEVGANIEVINLKEKDAHISIVNLRLGVSDRIHLARIFRRLRAIKAVTKLVRVRH